MKIMLALLKFLEPYDSNQSAASLTLHENNIVHVQLTSGTSSSNREEERPPEPTAGFGSRAGTTNCDASGLGGFVRRYLSTRNLRITSNFFRCTMYLAACVTLCTLSLFLSNNTHETTKKKKKRLSQRFQACIVKKSRPCRGTFARANQADRCMNLLHCAQRSTP